MNANQARKISNKAKERVVSEGPSELLKRITEIASVGKTELQISTGNLEKLQKYKTWAEKNGYSTHLHEKYDTQGDNYAWGYIHLLTINWS